MPLDVIDIRGFYASALGRVTRDCLTLALREAWPRTQGLSVMGLGFAILSRSLSRRSGASDLRDAGTPRRDRMATRRTLREHFGRARRVAFSRFLDRPRTRNPRA